MPCQVAQSHSDSKMWWNSGIVIVKCGGTEWHSVTVTVKSGTTVEQWQSRCHSNSKVWWNSHSDSKVRWKSGTTSVTVIVKSGGTMARSHGDSKVWYNSGKV